MLRVSCALTGGLRLRVTLRLSSMQQLLKEKGSVESVIMSLQEENAEPVAEAERLRKLAIAYSIANRHEQAVTRAQSLVQHCRAKALGSGLTNDSVAFCAHIQLGHVAFMAAGAKKASPPAEFAKAVSVLNDLAHQIDAQDERRRAQAALFKGAHQFFNHQKESAYIQFRQSLRADVDHATAMLLASLCAPDTPAVVALVTNFIDVHSPKPEGDAILNGELLPAVLALASGRLWNMEGAEDVSQRLLARLLDALPDDAQAKAQLSAMVWMEALRAAHKSKEPFSTASPAAQRAQALLQPALRAAVDEEAAREFAARQCRLPDSYAEWLEMDARQFDSAQFGVLYNAIQRITGVHDNGMFSLLDAVTWRWSPEARFCVAAMLLRRDYHQGVSLIKEQLSDWQRHASLTTLYIAHTVGVAAILDKTLADSTEALGMLDKLISEEKVDHWYVRFVRCRLLRLTGAERESEEVFKVLAVEMPAAAEHLKAEFGLKTARKRSMFEIPPNSIFRDKWILVGAPLMLAFLLKEGWRWFSDTQYSWQLLDYKGRKIPPLAT